ncbi:hypothetical protein GCM10010178_90520 [Lentzea flava]|uniref:DUF2399 domain-containing protein n=1 Tax=Lentzea flava TaxID=103732 RepID=A0ABQ2VGY5_9PSEU|nr:hypothetical protein GCM10010178_90520 [Lentzea flava]
MSSDPRTAFSELACASFETLVLSIPALGKPVTAIHHIGDIDRAGLRIPASANRLAENSQPPPVVPAVKLYDARSFIQPSSATFDV